MSLDPNLLENINANSPAGSLIRLLVQYRKWLLIPTVFCTLLAMAVVVLSKNQYASRQTLVVRDDMVGSAFKPGRFESLESMKSAQETILEMARRPQVIRSALTKLGPPRGKRDDWIDDEVIESTQQRIKISAPNGAEFGATEAIVLTVEQHTRERSRQFISSLLDEIEKSLQDFRSNRFRSMEKELAEACRISDESYLQAAEKLKRFEADLGPDLATLISLGDQQTGSSNILQNQILTLMVEQREAQSDLDTVRKQIQILNQVAEDPTQILEVPTELLQLLPTLDSLGKGLNDALLKYSTSTGKYAKNHPIAKADWRAVESVKVQIKKKLADSLASLEFQEELRRERLTRLDDLIASNRDRLSELSRMRVDYETLRTEVLKKADVKGKASEKLSDILTLGAAADEVNLFTRVDEPQVDVHPAGPSKKAIVLGGALTGLFIGIGLVMLVAPIDNRPVGWGPVDSLPQGQASPGTQPVQPVPTRQSTGTNINMAEPTAAFASQVDHDPADYKRAAPSPIPDVAPTVQRNTVAPQTTPGPTSAPVADATPTALPTSKPAPSGSATTTQYVPVAISNVTAQDRQYKKISEMVVENRGLHDSIFDELGNSGPVNPNPMAVAPSSKLPISEKIRQLEQAEFQTGAVEQTKPQPMNAGVPVDRPMATAVAGTPASQLGRPQPTSNPIASASTNRGDVSAPGGERQPDDRPAASKVNLDQLRAQIKAQRGSQPDLVQTTLQQAEEASSLPKPVNLNQLAQGQQSGQGAEPVSKTAPTSPGQPGVPMDNHTVVLPGSGTINVQPPPNNPQAATQPSISVPEVSGDHSKSPPGNQPQSPVVDQHITDLADAIRDILPPQMPSPDQPSTDR